MIKSVWEINCDAQECEERIAIITDYPNIVRKAGAIYDSGVKTGWYLGLVGRTANMTFCPKHIEELGNLASEAAEITRDKSSCPT